MLDNARQLMMHNSFEVRTSVTVVLSASDSRQCRLEANFLTLTRCCLARLIR